MKRDAVQLKSFSLMSVSLALSVSSTNSLSEMITFVEEKLQFEVPSATVAEEDSFYSKCTNVNKKIGNVWRCAKALRKTTNQWPAQYYDPRPSIEYLAVVHEVFNDFLMCK